MNIRHKKKLIAIISILIILAVAAGLILYALKQNINLFYTPTQLLQSQVNLDRQVRIGGYVKNHSIQFDASGRSVNFIVTDHKNEIQVSYHGMLPNLFREDQGVVITGKQINATSFIATEVLAKHDEKYMPRILEKELRGTHAP